MPSINAEDMDVDRTKGYVLDHILRAHSRRTHDGQDEDDTDAWAAAFQPTLPVIRSGDLTSTHLDKTDMTDHRGGDQEEDDDDDSSSDLEDPSDEEEARRRKLKRRNRQIAKEKRRRSRTSSSIVATCGGNTICLIDCRLGKVMAKYSHVEEEEFMCLAWTTLEHTYEEEEPKDGDKKDRGSKEDRHEQTNILAAAGKTSFFFHSFLKKVRSMLS